MHKQRVALTPGLYNALQPRADAVAGAGMSVAAYLAALAAAESSGRVRAKLDAEKLLMMANELVAIAMRDPK